MPSAFLEIHTFYTLDTELVLPLDGTCVPIQTNLLNLQSLVIRQCSPRFLSYLFEHLPLLETLSFERCTPWLLPKHPLEHGHNNRVASNLRYLNIKWNECIMNVKSINELFECDVLFSLTNFILAAQVNSPYVLHNLLSILSCQYLYSFYVNWFVKTVIIPLEPNKILSNMFEALKGPVPIELKLCFRENMYYIIAVTLPRMEKSMCVRSYLLTSLSIAQPFNSIQLHCLFSQLTYLRTLKPHRQSEYDSKIGLNEETLIDLLSDASLCNMLLSNGLRQLNLSTYWNQPILKNIAHLIVERIIELTDSNDELAKMPHTLISGLSK
ncbi:unnamed protein product [Rotaria socialis]|uniref:Uncharacterized protein n=1 Tax=Rotaria socialis TaxID=392032 RepID=A0A818CW77_9BILA|nr:unnamed protein product [Rotaria socialis]